MKRVEKYILRESEKSVPGGDYVEEFNELSEAQYRMHQMYKDVVLRDHDVIEMAAHFEMSAYVEFVDGNEMTWEIEKL